MSSTPFDITERITQAIEEQEQAELASIAAELHEHLPNDLQEVEDSIHEALAGASSLRDLTAGIASLQPIHELASAAYALLEKTNLHKVV